MAASILYDADRRMRIEGLDCACPCTHATPRQDIYVGKDLIRQLPAHIRRKNLGTRCVLVSDETTERIAGRAVRETLEAAGFSVLPCLLRRDGELLPDETASGEVLLSILPETEFLVAVGSGAITDITRINATRTGLPFVSVATAPSMDGYTSVVAPLLLRNVKIQRQGVCPDIIVCDLDILRTAPPEMVASGVGDVLGKYIANVDWQLGNLINDEPYCPTCAGIVLEAARKLIDGVEAIRDRTEEGMRILIEALLLSGVTILIIGNTRAVASIEHNIAQFWEMKQLQRGKRPPRHGSSVGVSTLLVWPLYARFAGEDLQALDLDAIRAKRTSREARERFLIDAYGEEGARMIMRDNPEDFLPWAEQSRRIGRAQARFHEIRDVLKGMPDVAEIRRTMRALGAPMTPSDEGIDPALFSLSMRCGKDYRTRYTLLKTLDECGLLESYLTEVPYA